MSVNGKLLMSLVMLAIFAAMVLVAAGYPPEARLLPLVIGIPGLALCLLQVANEIRDARPGVRSGARSGARSEAQSRAQSGARSEAPPMGLSEGPLQDDDPIDQAAKIRREFVLLAWFLAMVLGVLLFGFLIATPVLVFGFLALDQRESFKLAATMATAGFAVLYLIFEKLLELILFRGFVTEWLLG